jgi:phosphohistidine phosphatase
MKLYLLRHAEAVERGSSHHPTDADRPLTPKGIKRAKQLAHALRQLDVRVDIIWSSPLVRARHTAEIVARGLQVANALALTPHLAPAGEAAELIRQIQQHRPRPDAVLLVGHEPDLSRLVALLCAGGELQLAFKKSGLCRLDVETLRAGRCATLEWLVSPRWFGSRRARHGRHEAASVTAD